MNSDRKCKIVLDVMGADSGTTEIVKGGVTAARELSDDCELVLIGQTKTVKSTLNQFLPVPKNLSIKEASSVVPMDMSATEGIRMRDSSISVGLQMVKDETAQAFISPGNTGAVMASAMVMLGRMEGVIRPAIAGAFPNSTNGRTVVLDLGANADCKPAYLSQFAVMGSAYSTVGFGYQNPKVGLLSIGEERSKGNELIKAARGLMADSSINFIGNIEGRDILTGEYDVIVTDGFTGNILLKFYESFQPMMVNAVITQIRANIFSRFGLWLMLPFMNRMRARFDYAESGGAPLLGVNGNVLICHGSSSSHAIVNAVRRARDMIQGQIRARIHRDLRTSFGHANGTEG